MLQSIMYPINNAPNLKKPAGIYVVRLVLSQAPITYMGLPLGVKFIHADVWDMVIEEFEKKLFCFSRKTLDEACLA